MQIAVNIAFLSTFYVSFAVGLALVFGVLRVINFAHGELYMLGGYTLWLIYAALADVLPNGLTLVLSLLAAAAIVGVLGVALQLVIVRPLSSQPLAIFLATLGISYVVQVSVVKLIGPSGRSLPTLFPGFVDLFGAVVPIQRLVVMGVTLSLVGGLWWLLMRTRLGRAIRATAQTPTGAVLQGISMERMGLIAMLLGAALAGMSGVLMGSVFGINPYMGGEAIWRAFIIIIVGGVGSIPGAVLAGVLFGTFDTLLNTFGLGRFVAMADAVIMLLALSFLPSGLLGVRE